jgi:hypothetical protein
MGEWKYSDVAVTGNVDSTGALYLLNGLAPGTSATTRVGQKIAIRSIQLNFACHVVAGTGVDQVHRYGLLLDNQPNGVVCTFANFMSPLSLYGFRNLANRKRFKQFYDKTVYLNATGEPTAGAIRRYYVKFRKPLITEYNTGVAGTVADISTGALYFWTFGTEAAGATAGTSIGTARIRYQDM